MMIDKKIFKRLDLVFVSAVIALLIISTFVLTSASKNVVGSDPFYFTKKHILFIATGIVLFIFATRLNYTNLAHFHKKIYIFNLILLALVLIPGIGKSSNGAQSWIGFGSFTIQPSEFSKVMLIITFANYLANRQGQIENLKDFFQCFLHVAGPLALIMLQPDLGTGLVFFAIMFGMMLVAGANRRLLGFIFFGGIAFIILLVALHMNFGFPLPLKEYQLMRLIVFVDPYNDGQGGRGWGYNIIQSLVAVGSGGVWGKGLFKGTQGQLNFLPYHHTDFIFSVIGEELGFIGSLIIVGLFFLLLYRALKIALQAKDLFGTLIVVGIVSMFTFHILENIGMAIGVMPITGIPLPLFSYGGSNMWANLFALGLISSVNFRRQVINF